jgi:Photosynthetic reaction centre cytochrome C subunit
MRVLARSVLVAGCLIGLIAMPRAQGQAQQPPPTPPGGAPGAGRGQAPPENLKVLPKNWTRQQVQAVMQTFAESLGVMCTHCHAEDPNAPPPAAGQMPRLNYALDTKPEKEVARKMITMVMTANDTYMKALGDTNVPEKVSCFTCHRGDKKPAIAPADGWRRGGFSLLPDGPPARGRGGN